ncbi:hypothetical protein V6N13_124777 [Hibiscus sabdariffa]
MPPRACAPCHPMCLMRNFPGAAWCDGAVQPGCCHPPVVAVARLLFPMCTRCLALSRPDTQPCTLGRETDDVLSPPVLAHSRPECYTLSSSVPWQVGYPSWAGSYKQFLCILGFPTPPWLVHWGSSHQGGLGPAGLCHCDVLWSR